MGRKIEVEWQEEAEELRQRYLQEKDRQIRPRLHALWLLREGWLAKDVARILGIYPETVYQWIAWYRQGGLDEVCCHRIKGGSKGRLTQEQEQQLITQSKKGTFRTAQDIRAWIEQNFATTYGKKGIYRLLYRLKIHWKVPRPMHQKTSLARQEEFKKGVLCELSESCP
jgi:transposase